MHRIALELGPRSYEVIVGEGIAGDAALYPLGDSERIALVCDAALIGRHAPVVQAALAATAPVTLIEVPSGEASKSWSQLESLCDQFAAAGLGRRDTVVALGGGVLCDLAGFAAAIYMRGLRHIMVPTTLLAQVDASVGGKTAINIAAGKNLVGMFHQPVQVLADVTTLATMPPREYCAGLAESVKHGLLQPTLFKFMEDNAAELARGAEGAPALLAQLVADNVTCKAALVSADERESATRAHLNLGHTFAHAFEQALGYGKLLHGEAVAIGLVAACRLSVKLGLAEKQLTTRLTQLLQTLGLPTTLPEHDRAAVLAAMTIDKKAVGGKSRFVVVAVLGEVSIVDDVSAAMINEVLDSLAG